MPLEHIDLLPENESSVNVRMEIKKGAISLAKKASKPEQIINKLREAGVVIRQGSTIGEAAQSATLFSESFCSIICSGFVSTCHPPTGDRCVGSSVGR